MSNGFHQDNVNWHVQYTGVQGLSHAHLATAGSTAESFRFDQCVSEFLLVSKSRLRLSDTVSRHKLIVYRQCMSKILGQKASKRSKLE
jgi:hypothetical protein